MIWLIGNKGMLGSDIEKDLQKKDIDYVATDKDVDITNYKNLTDFVVNKNIDWIINCSAYTSVDKAEDEIDMAYNINAFGALNIAKLSKSINSKLIHISTDYVFDGIKKEEYLETDFTNPLNVYGKSKLSGEKNITDITNKYFIIRTAWLYGKNGKNFPYTMLRLFKERDKVNVVNDQFGSPTYTKDLSKCILQIILLNSENYSIYHFTNEGKTSWFEFAQKIYDYARIEKVISKKIQIIPIDSNQYPVKTKRPQNSFMSKEKIKKAFNIHIRNWEEALSDFIKEIEEEKIEKIK